jgi:hypothetical protein
VGASGTRGRFAADIAAADEEEAMVLAHRVLGFADVTKRHQLLSMTSPF